jgi:hypothetical protein
MGGYMLYKSVYITLFCVFLIFQSILRADVKSIAYGAYQFEQIVVLPGTPEEIYDAVTGDISPWWDHSLSEKPSRFYIEAKPGGGFYEIFDDSGDGVQHAVVIIAQRGKLLRLDGPLGLSGRAVQGVYTYYLESVSTDSTRLKLEAHLSGEIDMKRAKIVEDVWAHFIFKRLSPYINSEEYKTQKGKE